MNDSVRNSLIGIGLTLAVLASVMLFLPQYASAMSNSQELPTIVGVLAIWMTFKAGKTRLLVLTLVLLLYQASIFIVPKLFYTLLYKEVIPLAMLVYFGRLAFKNDVAITHHTIIDWVTEMVTIFALVGLAHGLLINIDKQTLMMNQINSGQIAWIICGFSFATCLVGVIRQPSNTNSVIMTTIIALSVFLLFIGLINNGALLTLIPAICIGATVLDSHSMAYVDELTNIKGRRALMQYVNSLGGNYSIAMADVDHFKKFNDTYGHDVGDQVLKLVASKLNKTEGGAQAFRYGGEEFTLIFPNKSPLEASPFVEAVRKEIENYDIKLRRSNREETDETNRGLGAQGQSVKVTMSFGISMPLFPREEFELVMKRADKLLYKSKENGRNRITIEA